MQRKKFIKRIIGMLVSSTMIITSSIGIMAGNENDDSLTDFVAEKVSVECEPSAELHNPVWHDGRYSIKSGTDSTDWSYVYFGAYPQSEITDDAIKQSIDDALAAEGKTTGDVEIDVEGMKIKYRKVVLLDANLENNSWKYEDGDYLNDENEEKTSIPRYFKWEPIKWKVLNVDYENGKLFVCADSVIDCQEYNETETYITWETSTMRKWLNGGEEYVDPDREGFTANPFYDTAFSAREKATIKKATIVNNQNLFYGTNGCDNTVDNVFLLSYDDVINENYGFRFYHADPSATRIVEPTAYANAMGASTSSGELDGGSAWWWLRSPGGDCSSAVTCEFDGSVSIYGSGVNGYDYDGLGVVPALYLDLSSDIWTVGSGEGLPSNPVYHEGNEFTNIMIGGTDETDWSYIYFGSYPQTEVTDYVLQTKIDTALNGSNTGDVEVDGTKYRKVLPSDANSLYSDYRWNSNTPRYFKWERIKWKVLNVDSTGNKLFVCADRAIDCQQYHEEYESVIWETSTIRKWLNCGTEYEDPDRSGFTANGFYETAFKQNEQAAILESTIVNGNNEEYGFEGGNNTTDRVFLLSFDEVTNNNYGFNSSYLSSSDSRGVSPTNYANTIGAYKTSPFNWYKPVKNVNWCLRSPSNSSGESIQCCMDGSVSGYVNDSVNHCYGVVPALYLNLSSDAYIVDGGEKDPDSETENVTVTFNANGGAGTMSSQSVNKNTATALSTNAFTKEGYVFLGWATSATATEATYTDKQSVTLAANTTLYAVWKQQDNGGGSGEEDPEPEVENITVTFDANGGAGTMSSQSVDKNTATALSTNAFTKEGYGFLGWATSATATEATYTDKQSVTLAADTTLYAVWKQQDNGGGSGEEDPEPEVENVTITFYANGGTGTMSSQSVNKNTATVLSANAFTREGYVFLGWATSSAATEATYTDKQSMTLAADTMLYAVWKQQDDGGESAEEDQEPEVENATVTFNANGGSGIMTSQSVNKNTATALRANEFTRSGYNFLGWSTSSAATEATYTDKQSVTLTADTTLYAVWKQQENQNQQQSGNQNQQGDQNQQQPQVQQPTPQPETKEVTAPAKAMLKTPKVDSKGNVTIKATDKTVVGYEIVYATNKKFKKSKKKTLSVKSMKFKLKKGKTWYIKMRAFNKKADGTKVYGGWSKVKKVKI